ncbi:unnamed protein product [Prunus armeniaca]
MASENDDSLQVFPPKRSPTAAVVSSYRESFASPTMSLTAEQFQKLCSTHQRDVLSMISHSSGLPSSSSSGISPSTWVFDSGATHHMTSDLSLFTSLSSLSTSISVLTANGTSMSLAGIGSITTSGLCLSNDPHFKKLIVTGRRKGGLYVLEKLQILALVASSIDLSSFCLSPKSSNFYLWHSRLGHVSGSRLKYLVSTGALGNFNCHDISDCSGCKLAKFSALPSTRSSSISLAPFDLIHSDVWGPTPISSKGGARYYVSFIDDYSRYCWIYLMKRRYDFFTNFQNFRALVHTQFSIVIKCFRCDLSGEYTSRAFTDLLASDGTTHQFSCTATPKQNGVAERKHQHIVETARSMLLSADVPKFFWGKVVLTENHVINRIPTSLTSGISPFERLYGNRPDYFSLKVFGCTCFVIRPPVEQTKLSARSAMCVFLGYGEGQKGYRCYDPSAQKLYVSRHVVFPEHIPFFSIPTSSHTLSNSELMYIDPFSPTNDDFSSSDNVNISPISSSPSNPCVTSPPITQVYSRRKQVISSDTNNPSSPLAPASTSVDVDPIAPRYPSRTHKPPNRFGYSYNDFSYSCYSHDFSSFLSSIHTLSEPTSYKEAICNPLWQQAMNEELSALHKTGTWDLVPLPPSKHAVGCRWEYGLDYEETFAPVAKMTSARTLLAVASVHQWILSQMDVKNAFLNGDLFEEVYMVPPPGVLHNPEEVCRLRKALYGLKQAPRAWFEKFSAVISSLGFQSSAHDPGLFVRSTSVGRILMLLYVDDMILTGDDLDGITQLKLALHDRFEMKDLGPLRYFLGIEVA